MVLVLVRRYSRPHRGADIPVGDAVIRRRAVKPKEDNRLYEYRVGRWTLVPGTEVSLKGKRGRFRFQYANTTADGQDVLTFVGGARDHFTSAYPEAITRVHRVNRTLVNIHKDG